MPAKKKVVKKAVKKVESRPVARKRAVFAGTPVFGWMIVGLAIGGLIVLLRYLFITLAAPGDVFVIEPSDLLPGMKNP